MSSQFWSDGKLEPKRSNRWVAQLDFYNKTEVATDVSQVGPPEPRKGDYTLTYLIKSFTRPTLEIGSNTIVNNFTSETEIIATAYQWPDISVTMVDVENPELNVTDRVYSWLTANGYEPNQSTEKISQLFANIDNGILQLKFTNLNANGKPIEEWDFVKPQPTTINFGQDASYDGDEIVTVTMGVTFVSANYTKK